MGKSVLALALLSSCWIGQALAEETCPTLTIVTGVDMKIGGSGRVFVPAEINGTPEYMLVDTGGLMNELTPAAADSLKLTRRQSDLSLIAVTGKTTQTSVNASFAMGKLRAGAMDFMVSPAEMDLEHDLPGAGGIIAPNLLMSYDVDFDFANKKLNLLSQEHCDGRVVYWRADVVAAVPFRMRDFHILVPVQLDGHEYQATLDTGADATTFNLDRARNDFALKPGDADTPKAGTLNADADADVYTHRFQSLALEGIAISNPLIHLLPDLVAKKLMHPDNTIANETIRVGPKKSEIGLPDMILGMDILHRLHLYVAYKEKKLYITPATLPAVPAPAPAPAPVH